MSEFKFVDEVPEAQIGRNALYTKFATALRENSGRWAEWPRPLKSNETAAATAANIRRGRMKNFPLGEFETVSRERMVFVRHIGGSS